MIYNTTRSILDLYNIIRSICDIPKGVAVGPCPTQQTLLLNIMIFMFEIIIKEELIIIIMQ